MTSPICVVTGGSRGIGRSVCFALATRGATVAFTYVSNDDAANETLTTLQSIAPSLPHSMHRSDIASEESVQKLFETLVSIYGRIDAVVNNAGICKDHDVLAVSFHEWSATMRETMETNFFGAANVAFLAANQFYKQDPIAKCRGRIVNITSRAVYRGELTAAGYASSKAALSILGQSFARRLAPEGILVFTVAPGWVETELAKAVVHGPQAAEVLAQHPLGRIAEPEEVGQHVAYLCLEAPAAMTGCVVDINGASYLR